MNLRSPKAPNLQSGAIDRSATPPHLGKRALRNGIWGADVNTKGMLKGSMDNMSAQKSALWAAFAAVILSLLLVAAKSWAWLESGSTALMASLVDSLIDALISCSNLIAIRYARLPADRDHRYGHGKAEGIAALIQAAFIGGSCAFVLLEAIRRFSDPAPVQSPTLGIFVLAFAIMATFVLTVFQTSAARASGSLAVEADAAHYKGDIAINLGVIISLAVGQRQGWIWLDPVVAVLVALWLLFSARNIGVRAVDMLLDREIEDALRQPLVDIIRGTEGVMGLHDLRTRRSGPRMMISFDIEVDPHLPLKAAHEISRDVETRILQSFPKAEVMIHIDPFGDVTDSRHKKIKEFHVE